MYTAIITSAIVLLMALFTIPLTENLAASGWSAFFVLAVLFTIGGCENDKTKPKPEKPEFNYYVCESCGTAFGVEKSEKPHAMKRAQNVDVYLCEPCFRDLDGRTRRSYVPPNADETKGSGDRTEEKKK